MYKPSFERQILANIDNNLTIRKYISKVHMHGSTLYKYILLIVLSYKSICVYISKNFYRAVGVASGRYFSPTIAFKFHTQVKEYSKKNAEPKCKTLNHTEISELVNPLYCFLPMYKNGLDS